MRSPPPNFQLMITQPPMNMHLSRYPLGRILLHLTCMLRDRRLRWHWAGVVREFGHTSRHPRLFPAG